VACTLQGPRENPYCSWRPCVTHGPHPESCAHSANGPAHTLTCEPCGLEWKYSVDSSSLTFSMVPSTRTWHTQACRTGNESRVKGREHDCMRCVWDQLKYIYTCSARPTMNAATIHTWTCLDVPFFKSRFATCCPGQAGRQASRQAGSPADFQAGSLPLQRHILRPGHACIYASMLHSQDQRCLTRVRQRHLTLSVRQRPLS